MRLDTGEVLRTFTVLNDLPAAASFPLFNVNSSGSLQTNTAGYSYQGRVTQAEFDSPISGTPVPYPSDVGAIAQRVFVGDEDGTIWRLDVSNPNPNQWFVEPFFDAYNTSVQSAANITNNDSWAVQRAPIVLSPTLSIGRDGNVVLNFGTGDTSAIGTAANLNYVYSVTELPNTSVHRLLANVNWYTQLPTAGEMVTGPAAVFDGGFYFASYAPASSGSTSCASGTAYLWGMDFTVAAGSNGLQPTSPPSPPNYGGVAKMLNSSSQLVQKLAQGASIIPGITITSSSICSTTTAGVDPVTGGPLLSMSNVSPSSYQISALEGTPGASQGNNTAVAQVNVATSVHTSTLVELLGLDRGVSFSIVRRLIGATCGALAALAALGSAVAMSGCQKDEETLAAPPSAAETATAPIPPPRDHLVPGELDRRLGGAPSACASRAGATVESAFPQQIIAGLRREGDRRRELHSPPRLDGQVSVGAASTMFERVQVPANPGASSSSESKSRRPAAARGSPCAT